MRLIMGRLEVLTRRCRNRGGDCACRGPCQAVEVIDEELFELGYQARKLDREAERLRKERRRLTSPMATLKDGFQFRAGLTPVMVFDGDAACFGYADANGEWEESDEWPFNETFIWPDDCERHGIRVE